MPSPCGTGTPSLAGHYLRGSTISAMRISVTSNIREVLGWTADLHPQTRFAVARSLTDVAKLVQQATPLELDRVLDRPTPFTRGGTFVTPARKDTLQSVIGFKDQQAAYMAYQVDGGVRPPKNKALRLPAVVQLNAFGNLPAGAIAQLIARARTGKRVTKRQSERFGVSRELDLFYGEPGDGRPAGIYKRVVISSTEHRLVPVVVFPRRPARYARRFDFYAFAEGVVDREFDRILAANWRAAVETARR